MRYMSLWKPGRNANPPTPKMDAEMGKLIEEMSKAGVLIQTGGWDPASPCIVLKSSGGKITVTDGPYAEAKEVVAGYAIMEAKSKQEVIEWSKRFLDLVGDGTSEVRELPGMPPAR